MKNWTSQISQKFQFRERKYPLHVDSTMDEAFTRANCQKLEKRKLQRKHLSDKTSKHKAKFYDSGKLNLEIIKPSASAVNLLD